MFCVLRHFGYVMQAPLIYFLSPIFFLLFFLFLFLCSNVPHLRCNKKCSWKIAMFAALQSAFKAHGGNFYELFSCWFHWNRPCLYKSACQLQVQAELGSKITLQNCHPENHNSASYHVSQHWLSNARNLIYYPLQESRTLSASLPATCLLLWVCIAVHCLGSLVVNDSIGERRK